MRRRNGLVVAAWAATTIVLASSPSATALSLPIAQPVGTTVGFVLVDSRSGETKAGSDVHHQFRSASLVKLLIAIDYFATRGGVADAPATDLDMLASMLRSSDDTAASVLWVQEGSEAIVERTAAMLALADTEPPADRGIWGYTATSAADMARVYEYLLAEAAPDVRSFILGNLRGATRCATDGRDQYFGIPRAVSEPWAVKQGWSGFGEVPDAERCDPAVPSAVPPAAVDILADAGSAVPVPTRSGPDIDLDRPAMHTTGLIGENDETIMIVLTLHPDGTSYDTAARQVTDIARALHLVG